MSKYAELIKALRCCCPQPQETCDGCSYDTAGECNVGRMMLDAAAAIEELQAEVKQAAKRNAELHAELEKWVSAAEQAGEPKRGEWIEHGEPPMLVIECSVCGQKYFNHALQEKAKYCSMCGAKMGGTE